MEKCQSYALTIRPLDGITDSQISKTVNYIKRTCDYYHVITEKTMAARHLHAGIFTKNSKTRANIVTEVLRLFKDLEPKEKSVLRSGIKIMYNGDFIKNYLSKGDDTVVIESHLPEAGHLESYFTPKPLPKEKAPKHSLYYHQLSSLWYEHRSPAFEVTTVTVRDFLFEVMYSKRVINVIRDDRSIIQTARHLTRWLNKDTTSCLELPPFEKEE